MHLGVEVDLEARAFTVKEERVCEVERMSKAVYCEASRNKRWVNKRTLAKWVGKINAWYLAFKSMHLYLSEFYAALASSDKWGHNTLVRLPNSAMKSLKTFW